MMSTMVTQSCILYKGNFDNAKRSHNNNNLLIPRHPTVTNVTSVHCNDYHLRVIQDVLRTDLN